MNKKIYKLTGQLWLLVFKIRIFIHGGKAKPEEWRIKQTLEKLIKDYE